MITDSIIAWFQQIVQYIVNAMPDAPIIAVGYGASAGTACCVTFLITETQTTIGTLVPGGMTALTNTPLTILVDWTTLGFAVGCAFAFIVAFFIIKILLQFWMMVKW